MSVSLEPLAGFPGTVAMATACVRHLVWARCGRGEEVRAVTEECFRRSRVHTAAGLRRHVVCEQATERASGRASEWSPEADVEAQAQDD